MKISKGKSADYDQEIVKRRFRLTIDKVKLDGKKVLDFGCGNGAQTIQFANSNCTIYAADVNKNDIKIFNNVIVENNIKNINPIVYNGKNLPIKSNSMDVVMSFEVLEHVESEIKSLSEIYRVLKPNGELILSVPNKWWIFETHGAHLPFLPWNRVPFFSWLPPKIHSKFAKARIYTKRKITELLKANGYRVKSCLFVMAPMDMIKNVTIKKHIRKTLFSGDETKCTFKSTSILIHSQKK